MKIYIPASRKRTQRLHYPLVNCVITSVKNLAVHFAELVFGVLQLNAISAESVIFALKM